VSGANLKVDRREGVAVVTIDRPAKLNALDAQTMAELGAAFAELDQDAAVRGVLLTGSGEKAFVAGADIKYMGGLGSDEANEWGDLGHDAARLLETMPKPTIAAINGFALGGGCELALACDLRYASSGAKLGQPEINLGIIPGWGGTQRLARLCGLGFAKDLVLTGRLVEADEALARGLVDGVHDPVLDKALETARLLATKSPLALAAAKRALNNALQGDHVANLEREYTEFGGLFASKDAKEGLTAFIEKREPTFTGR
jgi:enoyl-CoA hydratase